ncbi:hypothetical protein ACHAWF_006857 [Thalassiosira exigua]
MAPRRRSAAPAAARGGGGGGAGGGRKRPRPGGKPRTMDLSGHGGRYEDAVEDDVTPTLHDEDVESEEDEFDHGAGGSSDEGGPGEGSEEEEEEETADAKRLRLAREYLRRMEAAESSSSEDDEDEGESDDEGDGENAGDRADKVGKRIARERLRKAGLLESHLADAIAEGVATMRANVARTIGEEEASAERRAKAWLDAKYVTYHRGHDLSPTCVALSRDGNSAYSGAKDGSLFAWDVVGARKKSCVLPVVKEWDGAGDRNRRGILAVAASDDDRYLAVGGRDNCVRIFDVRTLGKSGASASIPVATMEGHKKAVTALCFRPRTLDLYSGSEDRCIRRYDLDAMTYVETLYGHQSPVVAMDCPPKNRPASAARDRTARVWKVEEDSHLVFRPGGGAGSAECVSAMRDGWFATGHDDGRIALWREEKKRPVGDAVVAAHGREGGGGVPRGVACCDAAKMSDVLATGSNDGHLRLWRVSAMEKDAGIRPLDAVPIHGHVNDIAMGPGGKFCVAAVGQEPRLGRWDRVPRAKNRFAIVRLSVEDVS